MMKWLPIVLVAGCAHKEPPKPAEPPPSVAQTAPAPAEPDDEIKVQGTIGSIGEDEIEGPFRRSWPDITKCYREGQAKFRYLGGKLELKIRIDNTGAPKRVFVSSSTVGNYETERCVLGIAKTLQFSKPKGGSEAEFTYPLEFPHGGQVTTWDDGRLSLARHKVDVKLCKAKAPEGLPASLKLTVYVAPGGKVTSAGLSADAPLDDGFAICLVERTRSWKLDDPLGRIAKATAPVME